MKNKQISKLEVASKYRVVTRKNALYDEVARRLPDIEKLEVNSSNTNPPSEDTEHVFISDLHYDDTTQDKRAVGNMFRAITTDYHLYLMGDNIAGQLRIGDYYKNNFTAVTQTSKLGKLLVEEIQKCPFRCLGVKVLRGNHDEIRLTQGLYGEANDSFSDVLGIYIRAFVADVPVEIADSFETDIFGRKHLLIHGHQFRSLKKLQSYYEGQKKYVIHGHFHNFNMTDISLSLPPCCAESDFDKSLGFKHPGRQIIIISNKGIRKETV